MTVFISIINIEKHLTKCNALHCCKSILIVIFMFCLILSTIHILYTVQLRAQESEVCKLGFYMSFLYMRSLLQYAVHLSTGILSSGTT